MGNVFSHVLRVTLGAHFADGLDGPSFSKLFAAFPDGRECPSFMDGHEGPSFPDFSGSSSYSYGLCPAWRYHDRDPEMNFRCRPGAEPVGIRGPLGGTCLVSVVVKEPVWYPDSILCPIDGNVLSPVQF